MQRAKQTNTSPGIATILVLDVLVMLLILFALFNQVSGLKDYTKTVADLGLPASTAIPVYWLDILALSSFLHFTPAFIAGSLQKRNTLAIFLLNLFLGWTFLGWLVALFWAVMHEQPRSAVAPATDLTEMSELRQHPTRPSRKCPFCAELIRSEAVVCRFCGRDAVDSSTGYHLPAAFRTRATDPIGAGSRAAS